jgi:hypothetical protein
MKEKYDILDYKFSFEKLDAKFLKVVDDIGKLSKSINIEYILVRPERIRKLVMDMKNLAKYTEINSKNILDSKDFNYFK